MPINLPTYADPFLKGLSVCAYISSDTLPSEARAEKTLNIDSRFGDGFWLHLLISKPDEDGDIHFHVDTVRSFGNRKSKENSNTDEILSKISAFSNIEITVRMQGIYEIPDDRKPKKGLIPALDVSMEIGDQTLQLSGARMKFSGEPYQILEWSVTDQQSLKIELEAMLTMTLDDDFLLTAEKILKDGLNRFVFSLPEQSA